MASQKTKVIEYLFRKFWDHEQNALEKTVMSLSDVSAAIRECNAIYGGSLSDNNPANFLKDILRGTGASRNWPDFVSEKRFTAEQRTGSGDCFEFIPFAEGQEEAFPEPFPVNSDAPKFALQSISLPLVSKSLGRADETWHIQTAIKLGVLETHFAINADFKLLELTHLQIGIKLRSTEIDALFLGKYEENGEVRSALVTCEAKQAKDPFIPSQIQHQANAALAAMDVDVVIPTGLRAIKGTGFYLAEFKAFRRYEMAELDGLDLVSDAIYELRPPVRGI